ncbi:MAG: hypothetical protein AAFQ07_16020 [Chloroflexota bacterium]
MAITFKWYDQERGILLTTVSGRWTWKDYLDMHERGVEMGLEAPHRLYVLVDYLNADYAVPTGIVQNLPKITAHVRKANPNWHLTVIVTTNPLASTLINLVKPFSPAVRDHYHVVATIEDALSIIDADCSNEM